MKSILDLFEKTVDKFPNKVAVKDENKSLTYKELKNTARSIASNLLKLEIQKSPIVLCLEKSSMLMASMLGVAYSGNFYTVLDTKMPEDRAELIFNNLNPTAVITDRKHLEQIEKIHGDFKIICLEDIIEDNLGAIDFDSLKTVRINIIDTDPLYVLYTSGSTGVPKGVVICHRSVMAYSNWVTETFDIDENTVFGNQTPFYFSMSVLDIFATIRSGATLCIIPTQLFSFPVELLKFINKEKINTIYWVPSALCLVANWKALDYSEVPCIKKILFAGESMPVKQLNVWRKHLPDAMYANLFGPTEVTDICVYYVLDRDFDDNESLPMGKPCQNCGIELLEVDGFTDGTMELCVKGTFLAMGYYNNSEKTSEVFVQNPNNKLYPEVIYKTGDLVKYTDDGNLVFCGRKDFQIKHMGYRIEPGEIETAISAICDKISTCVCIYDLKRQKIVAFYESKEDLNSEYKDMLKNKLPKYMMPNRWIRVPKMPHNANGKIDRKELKKEYID